MVTCTSLIHMTSLPLVPCYLDVSSCMAWTAVCKMLDWRQHRQTSYRMSLIALWRNAALPQRLFEGLFSQCVVLSGDFLLSSLFDSSSASLSYTDHLINIVLASDRKPAVHNLLLLYGARPLVPLDFELHDEEELPLRTPYCIMPRNFLQTASYSRVFYT